jgi:hypothetical protein
MRNAVLLVVGVASSRLVHIPPRRSSPRGSDPKRCWCRWLRRSHCPEIRVERPRNRRIACRGCSPQRRSWAKPPRPGRPRQSSRRSRPGQGSSRAAAVGTRHHNSRTRRPCIRPRTPQRPRRYSRHRCRQLATKSHWGVSFITVPP